MKKSVYILAIFILNIYLNLNAISEDFVLDTKTPYLSDFKISDVLFLPGNETLATTDEGVFYLWDIKTKSIIKELLVNLVL